MTSKPNTIRADLTSLPAALWPLCRLDHWVIWFWRLRKGRWTKPPYMAAKPSAPATTNSPTTWSTYELAAETAVAAKADGIGFALLDTPFAAIDLDHCVADDNIDQWAQEWVDKANGAYVERTPSGTGLRIIGLGAGEKLHRKFAIENAREGAAIELYQNCERYITITGVQIAGGDELPQLDLLEEIKARYDNGAKGFDFNAAGKDGSIDYDDVIKNGAPAGADVSAVFHSVVGHLAAKGMSIAEILDELARWPNGIGKRYAGRLDTEVKRSFEKWERKRKISVDADLEPDEPQRWAEVDKKGRPKPTRTNTRRALRALKISGRGRRRTGRRS